MLTQNYIKGGRGSNVGPGWLHQKYFTRNYLPPTLTAFWTTLAGFQIDRVGHNVLQFHELQLAGCLGAGEHRLVE